MKRLAVVLLALASCAEWKNFQCPGCAQATHAKATGETMCQSCFRTNVWAVCPGCGAEEALPGLGAWRCAACGIQSHATKCRTCSTVSFAREPGAPCPACAPAPEKPSAVALKKSARAHAERGDWGPAIEAWAAALEVEPKDAAARYALACCLARAGRNGPAFDALERAVAEGYANGAQLRKDPDLASLRGDPRWARLLDRARD
jgi:hypothetical protein